MKLFGPSTTKWWAYKIIAKLTGDRLLMANIFKLHEYQPFGLIKMHNMSKVWFANRKFNLLKWNEKCFHDFPRARNCLRSETSPWTILAFKRRLLCNFKKKLEGPPFYLTKLHGFEIFQLLLNSKSLKLSLDCQKYLFWI